MSPPVAPRRLVLVLGDQLDAGSAAFDGFDQARDLVAMFEVAEESTVVPSHKQRTALFLSAMRHFAAELRAREVAVRYVALDDPDNTQSLAGELARALAALRPGSLRCVLPGEHRVLAIVREAAARAGVALEVAPDRHFYTTPEEFAAFSRRYKAMRMEHFYRWQRTRFGVLLDGDAPCGGRWNFDPDNREAFSGPLEAAAIAAPLRFVPDAITREVLALVERRFPDNPGRTDSFAWPVTRADALRALADFVERRLPDFGRHQDAMQRGRPFLAHSLLAPALNLKLLNPREVVAAAELAYRRGAASIAAVEGFVRQILGWREFVRGIYWREGEAYARTNALGARGRLPVLYWTGDTSMRCLAECVGQTMEHGYAHHIQRLMITGNFALLAGVAPEELDAWYLAVYVDAVEWVTLPNTHGMVSHADGGVVGSKPYAASGRYVARMSDYCDGCAHDPGARTGPRACPVTTLYWDFLLRHAGRFGRNPRMAAVVRAAEKLPEAERQAIAREAAGVRARLGVE